ncbi:TPA: hypothetical protein ACGE8T_003074 [Klebsiella pneumoniae]
MSTVKSSKTAVIALNIIGFSLCLIIVALAIHLSPIDDLLWTFYDSAYNLLLPNSFEIIDESNLVLGSIKTVTTLVLAAILFIFLRE